MFSLFFTGIPPSVSAAIGFIALFGQTVRNGVVTVAYFNLSRQAGMAARAAVLNGSLKLMRTLLTLIVLPTLYLVMYRRSSPRGELTRA